MLGELLILLERFDLNILFAIGPQNAIVSSLLLVVCSSIYMIIEKKNSNE